MEEKENKDILFEITFECEFCRFVVLFENAFNMNVRFIVFTIYQFYIMDFVCSCRKIVVEVVVSMADILMPMYIELCNVLDHLSFSVIKYCLLTQCIMYIIYIPSVSTRTQTQIAFAFAADT